MIRNEKSYRTMPVGVVIRRRPGVTRWAAWHWSAVAILPGAGQADWHEMRREGDVIEYHAATRMLELHGAETEAYLHALSFDVPSLFVVMRQAGGDFPLDVLLVTASAYEAQDYTDSGEEIVERVPMPHGLAAWIRAFVDEFHHEEVFVKRQRDRKRVDLVEDGIGDARISQATDVYRSPSARRRRLS